MTNKRLTDERIEQFLAELDGYSDRAEVVRKWFGRSVEPTGDLPDVDARADDARNNQGGYDPVTGNAVVPEGYEPAGDAATVPDILDRIRERHGDDLKWLAEHRETLEEDWIHSDYYDLASIRDLVAEVERLRAQLNRT